MVQWPKESHQDPDMNEHDRKQTFENNRPRQVSVGFRLVGVQKVQPPTGARQERIYACQLGKYNKMAH